METSLPWAIISTRNLNKQSKESSTVFKHGIQNGTHSSWLYQAILTLPLLIFSLQSKKQAHSEDNTAEQWQLGAIKGHLQGGFLPQHVTIPYNRLSPAPPHCFVSCKLHGLRRKQNFFNIQRDQHCTRRLDLLITSDQAPHRVLVSSQSVHLDDSLSSSSPSKGGND